MAEETEDIQANDPDDGDWWRYALGRMLGKTILAADAIPIETGDMTALDRRARAIGNLAKTVRAVEAMGSAPARAAHPEDEDEMRGEEDDDDPVEREALRAELGSRLEHLQGVFERKRRAWLAQQSEIAERAEPISASA